ncbi:MAG TPA: peptidylprolyl isomerase [Acidimicrobiia bacterium]
MKRLLSLALASTLALAACGAGSGGAVAATVGDAEITVSDVESLPYENTGTMEPALFAQYLTFLIQLQILEDAAAEEFEVSPTDDEVEAEIESVLAAQQQEITLEQIAQEEQLSEGAIRRLFKAQLIQERVASRLGEDLEDPTQEEIDEARSVEQARLTEVCVRHILVSSEQEAQAALERIEGGESFEDVAAEVSVDPSAAGNGGDLGCAPAGDYVDEFRDAAVNAEIDAVTGPVQSLFGFHVLQVYDRTGPAPDELPTDEEIREQLKRQSQAVAIDGWLGEKLREAEVTVNEEYGTWVVDPQPMVQPPGATPPSTPGTTAPGSAPSSTTPASTTPDTTSGG